MTVVNVHEAKTHLSRLLNRVAGGEENNAIRVLHVTVAHGLGVESLPHHHGDPFDRLLVSQAEQEKLTLITEDEPFEPYGLSMLWAPRIAGVRTRSAAREGRADVLSRGRNACS